MLQHRCITLYLLFAFTLWWSSSSSSWVEAARAANVSSNAAPAVVAEAFAMRHLRYSLQVRDFYWPRGTDPCISWRGVRCQGGHVTGIILAGLKRTLRGVLQTSFALDSLLSLPALQLFNSSGFRLPGQIPDWVGNLSALQVLDLSSCSLNGSIPSTVWGFSSLRILALASNQLIGTLPSNLSALINLQELDLSGNELGGGLTASLADAVSLISLDLSNNSFVGGIPEELGKLSRLQQLLLDHNKLSGSLPASLSNLTALQALDLSLNSLSGTVPLGLGRLKNLTFLNLSYNNLSGLLLQQISDWPKLQQLIVDMNSFFGQLPSALSSLTSLQVLNLASNNFSGSLPSELSELVNARQILLSHNLFYGTVPDSLARLKSLSFLDLSSNYLNGSMPAGLLPGSSWNENCLSGVSKQRSFQECHDFYGARGLAFGSEASPLSQRLIRESKSNHLGAILGGILGGLGFVLITASCVFLCIKFERKSNSPRQTRSPRSKETAISIQSIVVNTSQLGEAYSISQLQHATQSFGSGKLLKGGHSGDLYRGVLDGGIQVVVKKIEFAKVSRDTFKQELEFFGRASHTRLVPLLGHCFELETEKFIVYKHMPNGDLAQALHKKVPPSPPGDILQSLDWITRLKIAIGIAEGLSYLHHECSPPVIHRDLKASSILLDDKYEVRLGSLSEARTLDGGSQPGLIARLLRKSQTSEQSDPDSPVASCSYDVYCFGKVLLELVSGKLGISDSTDPGADMWLDSMLSLIDRHNRESIGKLVDPSLLVDEDLLEEVWATAIIAKSCLNPKAAKRPQIRHILQALENPQKLVREDNFDLALKHRNSSRVSWGSSLFGSWRKSSSETVVIPETLKEERSLERSNRKQTGASLSQGSMQLEYSLHRRPGSNEIFPEPFEENQRKPSSLPSDKEG